MIIPFVVGIAVGVISIPILISIGVTHWLVGLSPLENTLLMLAWIMCMAIGAPIGYAIIRFIPAKKETADEIARYLLIGAFNFALNMSILDSLMLLTGRTHGSPVVVFSTISYFITMAQAFLWNHYWIFSKKHEKRLHHAFGAYTALIAVSSLLSIAFIHFMVNVIGAPSFMSEAQWANIAVILAIPISLVVNFAGAKYIVFRKRNSVLL